MVPLRTGSGTRLKILEAMAMERAVVSTTRGCAGLGLAHGESVWIADDAASFAAGVVRLLADPAERARLARVAKTVVGLFDWKQLGRKQRDLYHDLPYTPIPI